MRCQMHTLQLILRPTEYEEAVINKRFLAVSHIHNVCVKHAKKLLIQLDHDNEYLKQKGVRHHSFVPKKVIHFV